MNNSLVPLHDQEGNRLVEPTCTADEQSGPDELSGLPSKSAEDNDENEIELDGEDDDYHDHSTVPGDCPPETTTTLENPVKKSGDGLRLLGKVEDFENPEETTDSTFQTGNTPAIHDRLRLLKQKMNQARKLNQQAVQDEGRQAPPFSSSKNHNAKMKRAKADSLTQEVASQVLYDSRQAAEKEALNQFSVNDYHNPQGQFRNYQRNLKSLPYRQLPSGAATSTFSPTTALAGGDNNTTATTADGEREGARYLAQEMRRRIEKKQKRELKRKQKDMVDDGGDVSYINQRNKRFNQKINRTYDDATSEIRQNLERGTAL